MTMRTPTISISELSKCVCTASAPLLIDVRREQAFQSDGVMIVGAVRREPENVEQWCTNIPRGREVVVYCSRGHDVSQGVASVLCRTELNASYLVGGIAAWSEQSLPVRRKLGTEAQFRTKWVTRERPKIDRIACPWLISRFIDPEAEFLYVPADRVPSFAKESGATPYDIDGVKFGHEGEHCSFDAFIRIYGITDPALDALATIVRGADTSRHDLSPQCSGLVAISRGLSQNFADDHEMLKHAMVIYDALYTWCQSLHADKAQKL